MARSSRSAVISLFPALAVLAFTGTLAHAQGREALLLPQPVHITVVALDDAGKPVSGAQVGNTGDRTRLMLTPTDGRIELTTRAPLIVIRKIGYQSATVRPAADLKTSATLHPLGARARLTACEDGGHLVGLEGWEAHFRFARSEAVVAAGKPRNEVDYGKQSFVLRDHDDDIALEHGSGPLWSSGEPFDLDVWGSATYEEAVYSDASGQPVIRVRGRLPDGRFWGMMGHFMETVDYTEADGPTAQAFEQFLDHVCELKRPSGTR